MSLQRAWNPDPQSLPFARHIKTHALVSLVQKGLQYHELESSVTQVRLRDTQTSPLAGLWVCGLAGLRACLVFDMRQRHVQILT